MNTPTKQTVYRPSNVEDGSMYRIFDLHECEGDFIQNVTEGYGYFFTPEQLNEYTQGVIKQAIQTAAEKVKMYDTNEDCHYEDENGHFPELYAFDRQSITNTFEETFQKYKV